MAGVGLFIQKKYKDCIEECQYTSERLLTVKLKTENQMLNIVSIYSPEDYKPRREKETFYSDLQHAIDTIPSTEAVIIIGDFNARIGEDVIPGVKQRFNEDQLNNNGELMIDFCSFNNLRINNTFFNHRVRYKYMFQNKRGHKSMIDYIVTNRKIHPLQILDVRMLNSAYVGSDHSLLLGKIRMRMGKKKITEKSTEEKYNVEALWYESSKDLYQRPNLWKPYYY